MRIYNWPQLYYHVKLHKYPKKIYSWICRLGFGVYSTSGSTKLNRNLLMEAAPTITTSSLPPFPIQL